MKKQLLFLLALVLCACSSGPSANIVKTQCEYLDYPLGIDATAPRFTWAFEGGSEKFAQHSYQIRVATSAEQLHDGAADVWTSDKIPSTLSRAEYKGPKLQSHTRYFWDVTTWDASDNESVSEISYFETAKLSKSEWSAKWITDSHDMEFEPAPMFRKAFQTAEGKEVKSARVYISGTAYYELFLNGERVGDHYLDPGYTHYDKRILYVTHDITQQLQSGENAVGAVLGNGFYNCQSRAVWDFEKARWRARPRLLAEIRINYTDGTTDVIPTDETWKTHTGPYTYNNIYSGDRYDARLEEEGWNRAGFADAAWTAAVLTEEPAPLLVAQQMPAIRITKEIKPKLLKTFENNTIYVFDLGENIAGLCRLTVQGEAGTTFSLRHGELLKADGRLEPGNIDVYYHPQKPGEVFQEDIFILKGTGKDEVFIPQFSYHGFQYIEVKADRPVTLTAENLTGLFMHTDVKQVGQFSSSNELLNKIWAATNQSYRGNLHSIPTDCPQREKNGWTADAHLAIDLALLNFDAITAYEKWMNDFIDNQRPNGMIAGIIPTDTWGYGDWPGPVWDAALFIIPNALYDYYGETRSIQQLWPTFERYLAYLKTKENAEGYLNSGLGDWVFWKAQTPEAYTATLYYYNDYRMMARFATLLDKDPTPYLQKAEQLKTILNQKFFNPETGVYANGTQAAQGVALYLGIVPEGKEQLVADYLHKIVSENDYFLDFGVLGSKTVLRMLAKYGYLEDAWKMATKVEAPSWGYWVETMGYTTLAETWTLSPEFRDASLNHVFMGDISAWMTNMLAGINFDTEKAGFANVLIQPYYPEGLDWVKAEYNSVRGPVKSEWKREGGKINLTVTIPTGSTATIHADKVYQVGSGTHHYTL